MTFNGKAKSTSQFFYDLKADKTSDLQDKLEKVVADYFSYYSNFQNKDPIENVEAISIDFKCSNRCAININHQMNVIGLVIDKDMIQAAVDKMAQKYNIPTKFKL